MHRHHAVESEYCFASTIFTGKKKKKRGIMSGTNSRESMTKKNAKMMLNESNLPKNVSLLPLTREKDSNYSDRVSRETKLSQSYDRC